MTINFDSIFSKAHQAAIVSALRKSLANGTLSDAEKTPVRMLHDCLAIEPPTFGEAGGVGEYKLGVSFYQREYYKIEAASEREAVARLSRFLGIDDCPYKVPDDEPIIEAERNDDDDAPDPYEYDSIAIVDCPDEDDDEA